MPPEFFVHHQVNLLCSGIDLFYQTAYESNKIRLGATNCHLRLAVSALWLDRQEDVTRAKRADIRSPP